MAAGVMRAKRRTFGAIYEVILTGALTLLPFVGLVCHLAIGRARA